MEKKKTGKHPTADEDIIRLARDRLEASIDSDKEERDKGIQDLKFAYSEDQWDEGVKTARGNDRPALTINKLPGFHDQVIGDYLQNNIAIKVNPVDDKADPETAEVIAGLIRNIEQVSVAKNAYATGHKGASGSGYGAIRVVTEYAADDVFEQNIKIKAVENAFSVHYDPSAKEHHRSDGMYMFIIEDMPTKDFKEKYPNAQIIDFTNKDTSDEMKKWCTESTTRIAEYFYKEPIEKKIYLLKDGTVVDELPKGETPEKERTVKTHKIMRRLISGVETLEGPAEWPSKYFPVIPVWGKQINIAGERKNRGLFRYSKDPQNIYNYQRTAGVEAVALVPKIPFVISDKQLTGYKEVWDSANTTNRVYLPYKHVPGEPPPTRQPPVTVPSGITNEVIIADQEMRDTMSIQKASRGIQSNEKSGRAIRERKQASETANFEYTNNTALAINHIAKVIIDLLPSIYDTARVERVIGEDGSKRPVQLNQEFDENGTKKMFDLTVGKYDVTVDVGPGYATQRQETQDAMTAFVQAAPNTLAAIADLYVEAQDWPNKGKFVKRLEKTIPPELKDTEMPEGDEVPTPEQMIQIIDQQVKATVQQIMESVAAKKDQAEAQMAQVKLEQEEVRLMQEKAKLEGLSTDNEIKELKKAETEDGVRNIVKEMVASGQL